MKRSTWFAGLVAALGCVLTTAALAQPPGPPPEHRDPLRGALDANHDFELDADEIAKAPEAIKTLDKNGDGKLDREEMRPPMGPPPGGPGRGPGDQPRRPGESGGRPPREGEEGKPPRDGRDGARPGDAPAGERPGPERFLKRAQEFDADGDGKLDESELKKFAESMAERMRGGRGPGSTGGPPREGGERPERPRRPEE